MQVNVHLRGVLRDLLAPEAKGQATIRLKNDATVGDFLNRLGIKRRVVVAVNDQPRINATYVLQDGDRVVIYTLVGGG